MLLLLNLFVSQLCFVGSREDGILGIGKVYKRWGKIYKIPELKWDTGRMGYSILLAEFVGAERVCSRGIYRGGQTCWAKGLQFGVLEMGLGDSGGSALRTLHVCIKKGN
ncbi:hypothetical protein BDZ91DRAFT_716385 [Kalaharituber pfeilii]|nr:hypothetical protein BDZ91DRAFT_716385 [Kalaharituber pfeilii]